MKLCVIGPGAIADAHLAAVQGGALADPVWVVGRTRERAEQFAAKWGFAHATSELSEALADPAVELVLIASPNTLHASQTLAALEAGKHVIAEIPIAMTYEDAVAISERAAASDQRVLVCHTMRSFPGIKALRSEVAAKTLSISHIVGFTGTPRRHNENWVPGTRNWIDNILWHHCCHYLDAALWILGSPGVERVAAHFGRANPEYGMTMEVSVSFETANHILVDHAASYNVASGRSFMLFVANEGLFTLQGNKLVDEAGAELQPAVEWGDVRAQDQAMIENIESGRRSEYDVDSVLPVMRVLQAAQALEERL